MANIIKDLYYHYKARHEELAIEHSIKLHNCYERGISSYKYIESYMDYLKFMRFPVDMLNNLIKGGTTSVINVDDKFFDDTDEHNKLRIHLRVITSMYSKAIPFHKERVSFHSLNSVIPYSIYIVMIRQLNHEAANMILLGNKFSLGQKIGLLRIQTFDRNFNRKVVDKGETNKLKKQGIDKVVYHVDDTYVGWKIRRNPYSDINVRYYQFSPTNYIHTPDRGKQAYLDNSTNIDDVLNDNRVGNLTKTLCIRKIKGHKFYPNPNDL
jgi:hypothetical protein